MTRRKARGVEPRMVALASVALGAALCAGCGGSDDDDGGGGGGGGEPLTLFVAGAGVAGATTVVGSGAWMAYLADESASGPSGADLNGDGDMSDEVPVAIDTAAQLEYVLPVAARELAWIGAQLFLVVDEAADELDWSEDGQQDDRVLLHWSVGGAPKLVDVLDPLGQPALLAVGETLFYAAAAPPAAPMESSLRAISAQAALEPREVSSDDANGPLRPTLLAEDEGLLLLALDETREGRDLNGDGDDEDLRVLALLDGTAAVEPMGYAEPLRSLGLAARPVVALPFRARADGAGDWLVGVLVNEVTQGDGSLNDPTVPANGLPAGWLPPGCATTDTDLLDDVLFFVDYGAWVADPMASPPTNTGFAGEARIVIAGGFIGTLAPEAAQTGCSLNGDADQTDRVFRWVRAQRPLPLPPSAPELLLAVDDLPGGARGVAELQGRFVVGVDEQDEGRDLDGDQVLLPGALIGWLDPAGGGWTFDHEPGQDVAYVVGTWMSEAPDRQRLGVAFAEESTGTDINGDGDELDSIPTFPVFATNPIELRFPGFGAAVPPANPGIVFQQGWALYRVSEALDGFDATGDGQLDDHVLWRSRLSDGTTFIEAILDDLPASPAVQPAGDPSPAFGALLTDEADAGDLNEDGAATGFVVRYFRW